MSIFKVKQWWSNEKYQTEDFEEGTQSSGCMKIDKFNSHPDSDCVIVGEGPLLKIYKPNEVNESSHSILESQLNDVILQIETGKFLADSSDRQILLLHPNSYAVYLLEKTSGQVEAGEQHSILPVIKHVFTRKAFSTTCGPFGSSRRDLICVQALDGTLSFFDQDSFLFMCVFNDIVIPGPVQYIAYSDQFIICKSTWILEIYSYHQLGEFSELSVRANKKCNPQWTYNAGEEIMAVQVTRTSTNFSSVLAVGERHLYCFQDNGLMKFMIRLDYMPICFHAYLIGWYYEPNSRLLVMVASEDSKLNIYEGTSLLWSCDLIHKPISISRCYLSSLPGGIVTLSTNGIVNISYLGTEPDLNANGKLMNDFVDPNKIQEELEIIEVSLQKVLGDKDIDDMKSGEDVIKIKINIGKPTDDPITTVPLNNMEALQSCSMVVVLTCDNPKSIQSLQITYNCTPPVTCSDTTICFDNINGTEIIETQLFLSSDDDISDSFINLIFTVIDNNGKIHLISKNEFIPIELYCKATDQVSEGNFKLKIETNKDCLKFDDIFPDFAKDFVTSKSASFEYRNSNKIVTVNIDDSYTIEANELSEMYLILDHVVNTLKDANKQDNKSDFKIKFVLNGELIKQILHTFIKAIENHAKERIRIRNLEVIKRHFNDNMFMHDKSINKDLNDGELNVLQRQFTLIQKRLLVQYGSQPPGNCDDLEFLMNNTHERIKTVAHQIMQGKQSVIKAGNSLKSVGKLVIIILKQNDDYKVKIIEEILSFDTIDEYFQEWEETIAQSLPYILNKLINKTEKDKEKLAPVTDQDILSHTNLKKILKQLRIVLEKLLNENTTEAKVITRIEEFVEVI